MSTKVGRDLALLSGHVLYLQKGIQLSVTQMDCNGGNEAFINEISHSYRLGLLKCSSNSTWPLLALLFQFHNIFHLVGATWSHPENIYPRSYPETCVQYSLGLLDVFVCMTLLCSVLSSRFWHISCLCFDHCLLAWHDYHVLFGLPISIMKTSFLESETILGFKSGESVCPQRLQLSYIPETAASCT